MVSVRRPWSLMLAMVLSVAGCGDVVIRRSGGPDLLDAWKASLGVGTQLSARTQQTLRRLDLEQPCVLRLLRPGGLDRST